MRCGSLPRAGSRIKARIWEGALGWPPGSCEGEQGSTSRWVLCSLQPGGQPCWRAGTRCHTSPCCREALRGLCVRSVLGAVLHRYLISSSRRPCEGVPSAAVLCKWGTEAHRTSSLRNMDLGPSLPPRCCWSPIGGVSGVAPGLRWPGAAGRVPQPGDLRGPPDSVVCPETARQMWRPGVL